SYAPCDVSRAMVLAACQAAAAVGGVGGCFPLVCDLEEADDLRGVMEQQCPAGADRLMTFFGMLPNFEPRVILPRLAALLGPVDWLLVSANLAPGPDYGAGVRRILPQYDNVPTRAWLMTFLLDLGVKQSDGAIRFTVEEGPPGLDLKRVVAEFQFEETCSVRLGTETFEWHRGERLRLFFSYRFTPDRVCKLLGQQGIVVVNQWVTRAEEE